LRDRSAGRAAMAVQQGRRRGAAGLLILPATSRGLTPMHTRIGTVVLTLTLAAGVGCEGAKRPGPPVAVKGAVTLDGKPLGEGEVTFTAGGEPPAVMEVKGGSYSGAVRPGKNRVEVRAYRVGPKSPTALSTDDPNPKVNYLPDRYNAHSQLQADVAAGGTN